MRVVCCSVLLLVLCAGVALAGTSTIPVLAQEFTANAQFKIPLLGTYPGIIYWDAVNQRVRSDVNVQGHYNQTTIDLWGIPSPTQYLIQGHLPCKVSNLTHSMPPLAIPPEAHFSGFQTVNGLPCSVWEYPFFGGLLDIKWAVYAEPLPNNKTSFELVYYAGFVATVAAFEYTFNNFTLGVPGDAWFDPSKFHCPNLPPPNRHWNVIGLVQDAVNSTAIVPGVQVILNNTKKAYAIRTNSLGIYNISQVDEGVYNVTVNMGVSGYVNAKRPNLNVTRDFLPGTGADIFVTQQLPFALNRIILQWAQQPFDLDLHVMTPNGCDVWAAQHTCTSGSSISQLVHDVVSGFGPEVVNNYLPTTGAYKVRVQRWSAGTWSQSDAVVSFYNSSGLVFQAVPPIANSTADKWAWWDVFSIVGGSHAQAVPINLLSPSDI